MRSMTPEEARRFLTEGAHTGVLATVRPDGRPHTAVIWFVFDGDDLVFTTWHTSVKAANLKHNARVSLAVNDETPPYAYAIVEGVAHFEETPDPALLRHWATELARRYLGDDLAEAFGKRNGVPGEWLVRVTPTKITAHTGIAD